jgi:hypothetical protein
VEGKLSFTPTTDPITQIVQQPGNDGSSWTRPVAIQGSPDWRSGMSDDKSLAVLLGENKTATSTDGVNWTKHDVSLTLFRRGCYANGNFFACGSKTFSGTRKYWIGRSADGVSWDTRYEGSTTTQHLFAIAANPRTGVVIAIGEANMIVRSTDNGNTFALTTTSGFSYSGIACDPATNTWVITASNGNLRRSTDDGATWSNYTSGTEDWFVCAFGAGKFGIVNAKGQIQWSSTGAAGSWGALITISLAARSNELRYLNGVWWCAFELNDKNCYRSVDGITWAFTANPLTGTQQPRGFCYLPGYVIAGGNNGDAGVTTASTTKLELAGNTSLSYVFAGAPLAESGNGDDAKSVAVRVEPTATPPYIMIGGSSGIWDVGSRVTAPPVQSNTSARLYCKLSGTGGVTDLQSADPGYTAVAGTSPYHITFPALMPSGNAPDADIPVDSTLTVAVEASNTAGVVTATSNTVKPAYAS